MVLRMASRCAAALAFLAALATGQTWSPSNTVTATPLPCPLRVFPSYDLIGTVLSKSFQPDEASCMLQCCNVADLCVGYTFQASLLGVPMASATVSVETLSDSAVMVGSTTRCGNGVLTSQSSWATAGSINVRCTSTNCGYDAVPTTQPMPQPIGLIGCQPQAGDYTCNDCSTSRVAYGDYNYKLHSSGTVAVPQLKVASVPCVLLSNITQLIPSNGWNGGIKLSALGS